MGLHESQSRFYENILGRNRNFWTPLYEKIGDLLPQFRNIPFETFYRAINEVKPSLIRIDADEVTYCLHIILRYEIERAIFNDEVTTEELPSLWNDKMEELLGIRPSTDAEGILQDTHWSDGSFGYFPSYLLGSVYDGSLWNDKMEELLGIRPSTDAEGILQDTHWSDGSFGYFPSYLLGSVYDGMFLEQIEKELGSIDELLAQGKIMEITKWLNKNIHQNGSLYTSAEVIQRICQKEISAKPLLNYFNRKYSEIYSL